jgi:competence protein ComEC
MKRPLIPLALVYIAGILAGRWWMASLGALCGLAFVLLIAASAWSPVRPFLIWPLVMLVGWINFDQRKAVLSDYDLRNLLVQPDHLFVRGQLRDRPQVHTRVINGRQVQSSIAQIDVSATSTNGAVWQPAIGRILVRTTGALPHDYFGGQTVEAQGDIGPPELPVAEGLFNYSEYLQSQGIYYELRARDPADWRIIDSPARPRLLARFREWGCGTLALGLPAVDQTLLLEWALTLGRKETLLQENYEPYIRAGTYHIFAVDGLRIGIVSGIVIALLRALSLPRSLCAVVAAVVIVLYAAMTGWPPSAMRAIAMAVVVFLGWCLRRPPDLLSSLALAAILILLYDPRQLFQAGFQLSVGVVLCIILIMPAFEAVSRRVLQKDPLLPDELRPWWQKTLRTCALWIIGLFMSSLAAWLGSIPLVAFYFHLVTPVSGLSNVVAVPLCGLVLISNLSSLLLGAWFPFGAELFNHAGWFLMRCIELTSRWSANWPAAYYYAATPGLFAICVYYLVLLSTLTGWLFKSKWRLGRMAVVGVPTLVWCVLWVHQYTVAELSILALKGGCAIYVREPGFGNRWLIDCGDASQVADVTVPFLHARGVNRIPNFLLTHGERPYSGGAGLATETFRPKNIYVSSLAFRSPTYREFQKTNHMRVEWKPPLTLGDRAGPWTVLHPSADDRLPNAGDNALVLRGEFAGTSILLLSDLGRAGQRALLERTNSLHADVVVAAIPGEGEPLGDTLLSAIQPQVVIIADSEWPATKRAGRKLRDRLSQTNIPVVFESDTGAVTIELRSGKWTLRGRDGGVAVPLANTKHQAPNAGKDPSAED